MRIYVIKLRSLLKFIVLLIIAACVTAAAITLGPATVGVFNQEKQLPIYSVEVPDKTLALTFDCAWGADDIPDILNTLKQEDVKATFFIVGQWAEKFPEAVKKIAAEGHDVANHSWSHPKMGSLSADMLESELNRCTEKLAEFSGTRTNLFRPPYGDYSDQVIIKARNLGYYPIQWDVDSLDWNTDITPENIMDRIMGKVKNGSILLFHNDTNHTAKILPDIIKNLKSAGYSFKPVSELIFKNNYYIDYDGRQKKK